MKLAGLNLQDRRTQLAMAAVAIVAVLWLRNRRGGTPDLTQAVDPSTIDNGGLAVGGTGAGDSVAAALEDPYGLGQAQAELADATAQAQSAADAAFSAAQAANDAATLQTVPTATTTATPLITPKVQTGDRGQGAGVFTPAYASYIETTYGITPQDTLRALSQPLPIPDPDYSSLNRARVALTGIVPAVHMDELAPPPTATLPPSPTPLNDSPAPAPPDYPTPAIAGTPKSAIALHAALGRDPLA